LQPLLQDVLLILTHLPLLTSLVSLLLNLYLLAIPATILFRCPIIVIGQMLCNIGIDAVLWWLGVLGGLTVGRRGGTKGGWRGALGAISGWGDGLKRAGMRNLGLLEVRQISLSLSLSLSL